MGELTHISQVLGDVMADIEKRREPYPLHFRLEGLPRPNQADKLHWWTQTKETKVWARATHLFVHGKTPPEPLMKARAAFVRHSSVEPDYGNLVNSFKAIQDALCARPPHHGKVIYDDGPRHLEAEYRWEKCPPGKGHITVDVWEVE